MWMITTLLLLLSLLLTSITCFRRQLLRKMWPILLALIQLLHVGYSSSPWLYNSVTSHTIGPIELLQPYSRPHFEASQLFFTKLLSIPTQHKQTQRCQWVANRHGINGSVCDNVARCWPSTCFERAARGREAHSVSEDSHKESYHSTVNCVIRCII